MCKKYCYKSGNLGIVVCGVLFGVTIKIVTINFRLQYQRREKVEKRVNRIVKQPTGECRLIYILVQMFVILSALHE